MADRWAWNAVCAIGPAEGEQIVQATRRLHCDANGVEGDYGRDSSAINSHVAAAVMAASFC